MHKINPVLFCFLFIFPSFSRCYSNTESINDTIILKVDSIEITHYEINKRIKRNKNSLKIKDGQVVPIEEISEWIDEFINETVIVAEAAQLGYFKKHEIQTTVDLLTRTMLTQRFGELYREVTMKNMQLKPELIDTLYSRMNKKYHIQYMEFLNRDQMYQSLNGDTVFSNESDFLNLGMNLKNDKDIKFHATGFIYPSKKFWEIHEEICQMKEGEFSRPLYTDSSVYIVHLKKTEKREGLNPEEMKEKIIKKYKKIREKKLYSEYNNKISKNAKIKIDDELSDELYAKIKLSQKIDSTSVGDFLSQKFDSVSVGDLWLETILQYENNGRQVNVTVKQFHEYYMNLLLRKNIITKETLHNYLTGMVFEEFKYQDAIRLKLHKRKKFVLDQKNYRNFLIFNTFVDDHLMKDVTISDEKLNSLYNERQSEFTAIESINVTLLYFSSEEDAKKSLYNMVLPYHQGELKPGQIDSLSTNLIKRESNRTLYYNTSEFSPEIVREIFYLMRTNELGFSPLKVDDNTYLLVIKHEELSERIKSFEEVKNKIKSMLLEEYKQKKIIEFADSLKQKFKIVNQIHAEDFQ